MKCVAWILVFAAAIEVRPEVLRVPSEFATIQAALDSSEDGDTVLVEPGIYAEQLAISGAVVLKGNTADSLDLPIVDPSTLSNPLTRHCATLFGTDVIIEDFGFRNGASMYPREFWTTGGVSNNALHAVLRRCVFDSVHIGIRSNGPTVRLEDCRFVDAQNGCVWNTQGGIDVVGCSFQGRSYGWAWFWFTSNTSFVNCIFTDNGIGHLMLASGDHVSIRNCLFSEVGPTSIQVLQISGSNLLFEGNAFEDCQIASDLFLLNVECDSTSVIRDNVFAGLTPAQQWPTQIGRAISGIAGNDNGPCGNIVVENNLFVNCEAQVCILSGETDLNHNQILNCRPGNQFSYVSSLGAHLVRDNLWTRDLRALSVEGGTVNAEWNWWGHETGPFHQTRHPEGLGSEVEGEEFQLDFDPWYRDTLFWNSSAREPRPVLPTEVTLSVYPNPFNSTTTLELYVPKAQIVEVKLYDLLGREVMQLFKGPAIDAKRIAVNGAELASGIYFARASDPIRRRALAETKLLLIK